MLIVKILFIIIGLVFISFGYLIYFKEKYNIINMYEANKKRGIKYESYAKKIGKFELIFGICLIILGIISLFINKKRYKSYPQNKYLFNSPRIHILGLCYKNFL